MSLAIAITAFSSAAQAFTFEEIRALIENGQYDDARRLVASAKDENNAVAQAFTEALILKHAGQMEQSTAMLESIINAHPNFDRVRQELAHSYYLLGKGDRAKYQFELLTASNPSPAFRNIYDRYITDINRQRPWNFSAYIAAAPSSNINNGVASDIVVIGGVPMRPDNQKKSGVGLRFGSSGSYQFQVDESFKITLGAGLDGLKFRGSEFDELHLRSFVEFAYREGDWQFAITPILERTLLGWDGYRFAYGAQASVQKFIPEWKGTARFSARWREFDHDNAVVMNGIEKTLTASYRQAFGGTYLATAGLTYITTDTQRDFSSYDAWRPFAEISAEFPSGVIASLGTTFEQRKYGGLFPWTGSVREDNIFNLTLGGTFKQLEFKGFAPRIEYTYSRADSNIELFKYDNHGVNLYLTKDF